MPRILVFQVQANHQLYYIIAQLRRPVRRSRNSGHSHLNRPDSHPVYGTLTPLTPGDFKAALTFPTTGRNLGLPGKFVDLPDLAKRGPRRLMTQGAAPESTYYETERPGWRESSSQMTKPDCAGKSSAQKNEYVNFVESVEIRKGGRG